MTETAWRLEQNLCVCVCVCVCDSVCNEPARSFGEEDVVGVVRLSLDERYARVVLPVAHRLLEQRLVRSCIPNAHSVRPWFHGQLLPATCRNYSGPLCHALSLSLSLY